MKTTGVAPTLAMLLGAVLLTASIAIAAKNEPVQTEPRAGQQNRTSECRLGVQPYSTVVSISLGWGRSNPVSRATLGDSYACRRADYSQLNDFVTGPTLGFAGLGQPAGLGDGYALILAVVSGHSEGPTAASHKLNPPQVTAGMPDWIWCMIHFCKRWA